MPFLDDLASGRLGLTIRLPEHLTLSKQTDTSAELTDARNDVGWWFFFFPGLRLDLAPEHEHLLRRDVERHARVLFDTMFAYSQPAGDARPRTEDASWSPVIELERVELGGGPALTVLHRMMYQPTRESVMGHTLIPVAGGLFEARWLAVAQMTGYRESVLMMKLNEGKDLAFLPQSAYDDPAHDAAFPEHPVTRARAAKRWHEAGCTILEPAPAPVSRDVSLAPLSCVVSVPPRFMLEDVSDADRAVFCRASFAGTDGIDRLIVCRTSERIRGLFVARRLATYARVRSRFECQRSGLTGVTCEAVSGDGDPVLVTEGNTEGIGSARARCVWRWFRDDAGYVWYVALATTVAVPTAEMIEDVAGVARSWRAA